MIKNTLTQFLKIFIFSFFCIFSARVIFFLGIWPFIGKFLTIGIGKLLVKVFTILPIIIFIFYTAIKGNTKKTDITNLDIFGSNVNLSGLEVETANDENRAFILKDILNRNSEIIKKYDNVFIDCPPSLSLLTIMALVSANEILVPLQTEFFALEGITQLVKTIDRIKLKLNPSLSVRGILLTMFDKRNKLSTQVDKEARNYFKEKVYQSVIPRNVRLSEAPSHGQPCVTYDKSCSGSKAYLKLAEEFINQRKNLGSAA